MPDFAVTSRKTGRVGASCAAANRQKPRTLRPPNNHRAAPRTLKRVCRRRQKGPGFGGGWLIPVLLSVSLKPAKQKRRPCRAWCARHGRRQKPTQGSRLRSRTSSPVVIHEAGSRSEEHTS